jgi:hypothetical protein
MAWFDKSEDEYDDWMTWGKPENGSLLREYCYAECSSCRSNLYTLIEFKELTPVNIAEVGFIADAPEGLL